MMVAGALGELEFEADALEEVLLAGQVLAGLEGEPVGAWGELAAERRDPAVGARPPLGDELGAALKEDANARGGASQGCVQNVGRERRGEESTAAPSSPAPSLATPRWPGSYP